MMINNCYCCKYQDKETGACKSDHEYCNWESEDEEFNISEEDVK